jgi:carbohydrate-selective porin OprB
MFVKSVVKLLVVLMLHSGLAAAQTSTSRSDSLSSDTTLMNQFLGLFAEEDDSNIPEVQRSRRKQVDQLLQAILDQPGKLQFSGVATASLQAGLKKNTTWVGVGSFDIFAFTSFGKHALLFFDLEAIGGNGPDVVIPNYSGLNGDAGRTTAADGTDRLTVLEAWTEFKMLREIFTVTLGKIDLTNYFDNNLHANDETSQFISGVFVNNPVLPTGANSPGIRFRTAFINRFYIQYGLAMANPMDINLMENHLKMLETGFKLFPETGWEANFRIFGHEHPLAGHAQGYGISYDQLIANHFNVFGRYGKNQPELAEWHGIEEAWSAGLGFRQVIFQREFRVGVAYAETFPFVQLHPERMVELYLNNQLNDWVFISPHFQWIETRTPGTNEHFLAGLRLNFTY